MKTIYFATGNIYKFQVAQKVLERSDIQVVQKKLEIPEIQGDRVEDIASYSAKWACDKLNLPIAVTDAGYFIEALNGFPGPYIKYINNWLTSTDLLKLMKGQKNRKVIVKGCLAYCEPGEKPIVFKSEVTGSIALKAKKSKKENTTSINEIFIPNGYDKVESEIPHDEMISFWAKMENYWEKLVEYLREK